MRKIGRGITDRVHHLTLLLLLLLSLLFFEKNKFPETRS